MRKILGSIHSAIGYIIKRKGKNNVAIEKHPRLKVGNIEGASHW
jgi:hypothetical protein